MFCLSSGWLIFVVFMVCKQCVISHAEKRKT